MDILKLRNTVTRSKNSMDSVSSKFDTTEQRINILQSSEIIIERYEDGEEQRRHGGNCGEMMIFYSNRSWIISDGTIGKKKKTFTSMLQCTKKSVQVGCTFKCKNLNLSFLVYNKCRYIHDLGVDQTF